MSTQLHDNTIPLPRRFSADDGDVADDAFRLGFDDDALALIEEGEELAALEQSEGPSGAADGAVLPGELGMDDSQLPGEGGGLVDQPSKAPSRKVMAAGLGGLLGALPAPLLSLLDTISVPQPTLAAISSALTLIGALASAYLARERGPGA